MSELITRKRKEALKEILRRLHAGEDPDKLKVAFREAMGRVSPAEIAAVEEELIQEGLPREEIRHLCQLHLALFEESLEGTELPLPAWHPLSILYAEHRELLHMATTLAHLAQQGLNTAERRQEALHILEHLKDSESHYLREENVLFPYLERQGITEPPRIMWMEHDEIRKVKKALVQGGVESPDLPELALALSEWLTSHFTKENRILFPTAFRVLPEEDWPQIRAQFDEIGYCCFTPSVPPPPRAVAQPPRVEAAGRTTAEVRLRFPTGELTPEEVEAMFNALPVDITFVDKDDTVRYYSAGKERIFVRTPAVIGRKVQDCHPQKSVHVVEKILADFKAGRREVAEFWINYKGRFVYIRYFPVWGKNGEYLGTLEVTQDVTHIRGLSGEKRLLDEGEMSEPNRI